jgi:carbamoyltransferase
MKYTQLEYNDLYKATAKHIQQGRIVGWYQGRSECGPRALGNRSILADPISKTAKDHINSNIKYREWYRPFAPSILSEHVHDWFLNAGESKYMLNICRFKKGKGEIVQAVNHKDNTARIQTVSKEDNEHFYNLISAFYELTSIPMLLNTSFNAKGEPIVDSPEDAFKCFKKINLDILVLKNFIIER